MLDRAISHFSKAMEICIAVMLALMVILVFGNVVLRYGFNSGIMVSEEVSRLLFVWMTFIGAALAVREHTHLGVDSLVRVLSRRGKLICALVSRAIMLFATYLLFEGSWTQMEINFPTSSPVSGISMAWFYIPGVVASVAMGLLLALQMVQLLLGQVKEEDLIMTVESEEMSAFERSQQDGPRSTPADPQPRLEKAP